MTDNNTLEIFNYQFDTSLKKEIINVSKKESFKKDDIIVDIGQDLKSIPLVVKGTIKVLREDKKEEELLLYMLEAGDTCAMSLTCCLSKSTSKIRAIADEDVEVIMIPLSSSENWFHINTSWRNFILQSYQNRFDEMLETIDSIAFLNMDKRLFKYLNEKVILTSKTILNISHKEIANDLHTSRVVISRLLKQLENEKKLKLGRNKIELVGFK